ncbi:hypothetical protein N2152v2_007614 [Parachlorella kessleri]
MKDLKDLKDTKDTTKGRFLFRQPKHLCTDVGHLIEERLAAATAVPPSQRSPEVAAFIECCQLQGELADELVDEQRQGKHSTRQQQALAALKFTSLVEKMQHPVLAARLRQELQQLQADLPSSLLSYEELLAYLVWLTGVQARDWAGATDADIQADIHSAVRAEAEMLPKLVPNNLHLCFAAIRAAEWLADHTVPLSHTPISVRLLKDLMQRAEQQGSDFIVALCGYELADLSKSYLDRNAQVLAAESPGIKALDAAAAA